MADISKIKVDQTEYDIKDSYAQHIINILLGIEKPENPGDSQEE